MNTDGHRSAFASILMLTLAACVPHAAPVAVTPALKGDATGLTGSEWILDEIGSRAVLDNVQATLAFPEAGVASGNASCNRFSGNVTVKDDAIAFGTLVTTRMACGDAVDRQESEYLKALHAAERYKFDGPYLLIVCKGMDKPLRFTRATSP